MEKGTRDTHQLPSDGERIKLRLKISVLNPVSESTELILRPSALIRIFCKTTMPHLLDHWRF